MQQLIMRLAFFGALTAASGCASVKEVMPDFTPIVLKRPIYLVTDKALVSDCKSLGAVSTSTLKGGMNMQKEGSRDMRARMAQQAEEAGGNVVLENQVESGFMGGKANGEAFECSESQLKVISNSKQILFKPTH